MSPSLEPARVGVADDMCRPEGLAIIDLDSPYSPPRRLSSHGLPWLVVDVQWSPFAVRDGWVASTANHRCLVWNVNMRDDSASGAIEHSLQAHSRAITDINFSAHHPDMLATCSVDGYAHCWDLRRPRQPALSFCDWFAGATQVKYNRQDPHILASSHDRWLHIWDDRKAAEPLRTISAHTSKIYGLDWNRARSTGVVTCSLDKSIKFWDYGNQDDVPERVIRTDFPVWRARHTPFGWGLLAMSQTEPGSLYLFDTRLTEDAPLDGYVDPVAVFPAHENHKAKEFLWRYRGSIGDDGTDSRDFQLVSWGEDNDLRLRRMEPADLAAVGYSKGGPARKNVSITRKGAVYKTFRTIDDGAHRDRRSATMSDQRPGTAGSHFPRSALTMSMQAPRYKASSAWKGPSMTARTVSSKDGNRSHTQIGWMKGVSMTKRKSSSDSPQRGNSKDSSMFSPGFHDDDWSQPETVQEEVVRISTQLPNIKWENIDMDSLSLNASLKGPWGAGGEAISIKVRVDIPKSYPKLKPPRFYVEQSPFMPEETHRRIGEELQELAGQFLKRKKGCLDVVFTYLLGEVDLETSTTFFKNVRDLDDDLDGLADDSSTDDDAEIPAGGSASMSQELTVSTELDTTLAPTLRPTVPPLRRSCGARFSNDGRLICFFPTKEERARALQTTATEPYKERPRGEPTFAGFGKLAHEAPAARQKYVTDDTSATEDQSGESDGSDASSSSTDSELTTMHKISLWYRPGRHVRKTWSAHDSVRSSGGGTGAGTGTGTGTSRRRPGKPKSIVSIHDMRSDLPAKRQFAEEYAIFGDGSEVCEHNAKVAEKYGYQDLVDVWKYAALLLRSDIPLRLEDHHHKQKSVLVIAKEAVQDARHDEDLLSGRVQWGRHPLAQDFIRDLFDYFERMADVQMLAMLSCIFGESSTEDGVAYAESHLTQPETPLPMKAPSFSLEYFPTNPELWNLQSRSQGSSSAATPKTYTPVLFSDSQNSEDALWTGDPDSFSCGETPPLKPGREHLAGADQTQSLSTSPNSRSFRRVNSAMASTFTASIPRAWNAWASSSPPEPPPTRKRPSPAETSLGNIASANVTWGGSTVLGAAPEPPTARTSVSDDDFRREDRDFVVVGGPVGVVVHTENDRLFDDDGWMMTPLLEHSRDSIYARYRYAYSEMLLMWGQPLARLEIMKFNVLKAENLPSSNTFESGTADSSYHESYGMNDSNHSQPQPGATSPTILLGGRREQLLSLRDSGRGLDIRGRCGRCDLLLDPLEYTEQDVAVGGAAGTCSKCHRTQRQLRCVYCTEPIDALYPPCLGCGCASHEGCLAEWHAAGETTCPAGDECLCVEEAGNGTVEAWHALRATLARDQERMGEEHSRAKSGAGGAPAARARRRSVPARIFYSDDEDDEKAGRASLYGGDEDAKDEWESVASHSAVGKLSAAKAGGQPSPLSAGHLSAARISLGNRLRPAALRRKSGGLMQKK